MNKKYDAVALFSGGLDSILAVKTVEEQGLKVKCLHFITPFFGKPDMLDHWQRVYGVDVDGIDIGSAFAHLLRTRPEYGFGKLLNPCVDCKILMMRHTRQLVEHYGARCVISGEVLGQRPMSQRRDTLNAIRRDSGLQAELLRPLSARLLDPTEVEDTGLVDRQRLHAISGRGRTSQLNLAKRYGITEIPTPAGGCRLTEQENACRYWAVLTKLVRPEAEDFELAHTGRQLWSQGGQGRHWLCVGRHAQNNADLERLAQAGDIIFKMRDFAGPLGLARQVVPWDEAVLRDAAAMVASFAPRAVRQGGEVVVSLYDARQGVQGIATAGASFGGSVMRELSVLPTRQSSTAWREPCWEEAKMVIREEARQRAQRSGKVTV